MVSPSEGVQVQLLEGFTTSHWGVHEQLLGWGFMANCSRGFVGSYYGRFMDSPSHRVHGWLLEKGSQPVASRSVYSDELALFIIVIKTLVAGD